MLYCEPSNIFRGAGNDYNVKVMNCKKYKEGNMFVKRIAQIIKEETGYDPHSRVKYRGRKFVESRQIMASILSDHTTHTQATIGKEIGGFDHATVVHSKMSVDNLCDTDKIFRDTYNRIDMRVRMLIK